MEISKLLKPFKYNYFEDYDPILNDFVNECRDINMNRKE